MFIVTTQTWIQTSYTGNKLLKQFETLTSFWILCKVFVSCAYGHPIITTLKGD